TADEALLFAGEGDEDESLIELVLAHDAGQLHDVGGTAAIVADARCGEVGVLLVVGGGQGGESAACAAATGCGIGAGTGGRAGGARAEIERIVVAADHD